MTYYIHPLQQQVITETKSLNKPTTKQSKSFSDILSNVTELKMSKHAKERMAQRNISIPPNKWKQINAKVLEARAKGVTDALVVVDDTTLIVSAKNNTVVTVLNKEDANNKIFTNINGTIFI